MNYLARAKEVAKKVYSVTDGLLALTLAVIALVERLDTVIAQNKENKL